MYAKLTFECPYCGVKAEETELPPGGEADLKRFGPGSSDDDFEAYLFMRENTKGVHFERCRYTVTMEVYGSYPVQTPNRLPIFWLRSRKERPDHASHFSN